MPAWQYSSHINTCAFSLQMPTYPPFYIPSPVHALRQSHERVTAALASSQEGPDAKSSSPRGDGGISTPPLAVLSWSAAQLTGAESWDPSKAWNFRKFQEKNAGEPARSAFPAPVFLPPLPASVVPGPFPELESVLSHVGRYVFCICVCSSLLVCLSVWHQFVCFIYHILFFGRDSSSVP